MRTLSGLLLLFGFLTLCSSQGTTSLAQSVPQCALQCLATAITETSCNSTDTQCLCTNTGVQDEAEACVLRSCTLKDALKTKKITKLACNAPVRDRTTPFRIVNATLGVISALCVILRIAYKTFVTVYDLGMDDYFIVLTLITGVPGTVINDRGVMANGMGKDIWTLEYRQITNFIRWFYALEILYFASISLLKVSLLFFYYHIFPGTRIRRVIVATSIFNALFGIAFVAAAIFQCQPVSFYWNRWDGESNGAGTCININALAWANAAISIALDIWMLAIPLSQLTHLKLAWKKKVGVVMMFGVGTFVTVVSILRLQSLVHFATSTNPTWDQYDVAKWSTIEINVGIMCACMPAIRVILVRLFPKVLGNTTKSNTERQYSLRCATAGQSKGGPTSGVNRSIGGGREGDWSTITYTKTFEVQREDRDNDNDTIGLVIMDDLSLRKEAKVVSGNSSQVSV